MRSAEFVNLVLAGCLLLPVVLRLNQIYYVFGFLYVVFFILIATCAEITMVMCYFQLCNEDYHW